MNILTIIPITGENSLSTKYFVGFLMDLVEQPTAIRWRENGLYGINYLKGAKLNELSNFHVVAATLLQNRKNAFRVLGERFTDERIQEFLHSQKFHRT